MKVPGGQSRIESNWCCVILTGTGDSLLCVEYLWVGVPDCEWGNAPMRLTL